MFGEKLTKFLKEDGLTVAIVVILIVAYALLRTPGDAFASMAELEAQLTTPPPKVVEFYSNTCSICLVSKPKIDQLEKDLAGEAKLLRLNVKDQVGRTLAAQWGVRGVPTFFVVDEAGNIVYAQAGAPNIEALRQTVANLDTP